MRDIVETKKLKGNASIRVESPNSKEVYQDNFQKDEEIDLAELWNAIWSGKLIIIAISMLFAISSIIYAINQPDIYKASTLLSPAGEQGGAGGLAKMAGQFGGLASLAGISLGDGATDKTGLALEVLKSRVFIENFIKKHDLLLPLMAIKEWDATTNALVFDDDIYDVKNNKWIRKVSAPKKTIPSSWEAFVEFKNILSVSKDKETGMITLTIEHYSPHVATEWVSKLVEDINSFMREQDKLEAQNSIDFLSVKLSETELTDMQTVFYQLIEEQTKTIMLAEVSKEYVLKTIDPANAPDEKAKPNRALIVILSTVLGGLISVFIVIVRFFSSSNNLPINNTEEKDLGY